MAKLPNSFFKKRSIFTCIYLFISIFKSLFAFQGLFMVRLNAALPISNITSNSSSTASPVTVSPVIGYGHFNVSGNDGKICILLDLSCSIAVNNKASIGH